MSKPKYAICPDGYAHNGHHIAIFTPGKRYEIDTWDENSFGFYIKPNDSLGTVYCLSKDCAYLQSFSGQWRFSDDELEQPKQEKKGYQKPTFDPEIVWKAMQDYGRG